VARKSAASASASHVVEVAADGGLLAILGASDSSSSMARSGLEAAELARLVDELHEPEGRVGRGSPGDLLDADDEAIDLLAVAVAVEHALEERRRLAREAWRRRRCLGAARGVAWPSLRAAWRVVGGCAGEGRLRDGQRGVTSQGLSQRHDGGVGLGHAPFGGIDDGKPGLRVGGEVALEVDGGRWPSARRCRCGGRADRWRRGARSRMRAMRSHSSISSVLKSLSSPAHVSRMAAAGA
jgi:hypothetical protein